MDEILEALRDHVELSTLLSWLRLKQEHLLRNGMFGFGIIRAAELVFKRGE